MKRKEMPELKLLPTCGEDEAIKNLIFIAKRVVAKVYQNKEYHFDEALSDLVSSGVLVEKGGGIYGYSDDIKSLSDRLGIE